MNQTPEDRASARRAKAVTLWWSTIVPIVGFLGGLSILLYQGIIAKEANYTACGSALIAMGLGGGGFLDLFGHLFNNTRAER